MADEMTNADVLANLDAFVKTGGMARAEKAEQQRANGEDDVQDVKGDDNEPEPGESEPDGQDEAGTESDDEQEAEDTESQAPQRFKVKVDGEELEITLDEALAGYSREADYTRKNQAFTKKAAEWEAQKENLLKADRDAIQAQREQYKTVLDVWEAQLQQLTGNTPEWDKLRSENPAEWSARMLERRQQLDQLSAITTEKQRLKTEDDQKQQGVLRQKFADEQRKMLDANPEWKDQAVFTADSNKIFAYVESRGYSRDEVGRAVAFDHRLAGILKDAAAYRALQTKKPEAQKKVEQAKPLPPGNAPPKPSQASALKKLMENQAKRGDRESTARAFDALGISR